VSGSGWTPYQLAAVRAQAQASSKQGAHAAQREIGALLVCMIRSVACYVVVNHRFDRDSFSRALTASHAGRHSSRVRQPGTADHCFLSATLFFLLTRTPVKEDHSQSGKLAMLVHQAVEVVHAV
jgi:hypothetical protein